MTGLTKLLIFLAIFFWGFFSVVPALAIKVELQVPVPGVTLTNIACEAGKTCGDGGIPWLAQYISGIFRFGVGIAAILAVIMMMVAGFIWLTSAGNPGQITKAKDFISSSLLGLFLALFSYVILNTINPQLVTLKVLSVKGIEKVEIKYDEMTLERTDELLKFGPMQDATYQDTNVNCQTPEGCSNCVSSVTYYDRSNKIGRYDPISGVISCRWSNGFCVPSVPANSEVYKATPCTPISQ